MGLTREPSTLVAPRARGVIDPKTGRPVGEDTALFAGITDEIEPAARLAEQVLVERRVLVEVGPLLVAEARTHVVRDRVGADVSELGRLLLLLLLLLLLVLLPRERLLVVFVVALLLGEDRTREEQGDQNGQPR